jgi:isoaspartyl peptidase/L-asparaginase-like protein (Ntn-hydrolase superfamily)
VSSIIVHGGAGAFAPGKDYESGLVAALHAAKSSLDGGGTAVDAVVAAIVSMEDDPVFNAGLGSSLGWDGEVETDASIMSGEGACGAVACLRAAKNPILAARHVMDSDVHVMLAGAGADAFARSMGLPEGDLVTEKRRALHARLRAEYAEGKDIRHMPGLRALDERIGLGTVGAVVVDESARVAAGTSTGGMMMHLPGRVGDSAIIGAGTYASTIGGVSLTGHGEPIIRHVLGKVAVEAIEANGAREGIATAVEIARSHDARIGIIGLEANGAAAFGFTTDAMCWASLRDETMRTFLEE